MRVKCVAVILTLLTLTLIASAQNPSTVTQIGQFTASNLGFQSYFGTAAISANTIAVSAPDNDLVYGALYVYEKPSTGWAGTMNPTAMIYAAACNLGWPLAISADGTTIAASIGGCYGGLGPSGSSIAVFVKPATGWQTVNAPTALVGDANGSGSRCGFDFSMTPDGKTIACSDSLSWARKNFLFLFDRPAGGWAGTVSPTSSIQLSYSPSNVAINSKTVAVTTNSGPTYVYQRTSGGIQQLATLNSSDGANLCCYVVMDGQAIVVNGYASGGWAGKAYLFSKPSTGWANATETAQFTVPSLGSYSFFGSSMALSGKALLIGGRAVSAAYMFLEPATGWQTTSTPNITLLSTDPNQQAFGDAVAMQGSVIVIGDLDDGAQNNQNGAAYIYQVQ